jgi:hypothetical protein
MEDVARLVTLKRTKINYIPSVAKDVYWSSVAEPNSSASSHRVRTFIDSYIYHSTTPNLRRGRTRTRLEDQVMSQPAKSVKNGQAS